MGELEASSLLTSLLSSGRRYIVSWGRNFSSGLSQFWSLYDALSAGQEVLIGTIVAWPLWE